ARVLGLPYPGGPLIDALADEGDPHFMALPHPHPEGRYDYSFSGLKTALLNAAHKMNQKGEPLPKADMAASFRYAVCDSLTEKAVLAAKETGAKALAMAGGVSANKLLRQMALERCQKAGLPLYVPQVKLCTDNAAMIGSAAYYQMKKGRCAGLDLNAVPALRLV
ncbi:MAG: tRNA (adenosine(37)-N6)-threonylcarbamoyltransferase complex transferase subunit TsaD, partial [Clostridia bacterium]|nr:tRNA (adenosine(37)-N6)-threonylcarbamoyltransferase complex transferase subunit TsaD [Clostridia bacterium]